MSRIANLKVNLRAFIKWLLLVTPLRNLFRATIMRAYWRVRYLTNKYDGSLPKVTLVTALYNNEKLIGDAIRSARAQSYANVEHIIVDDGSTDASAKVVRKFIMDETKRALKGTRPNVQLIYMWQKNAGPGAARNAGVHEADDPKYLLFLDSDDLLPVEGIKRLVDSAEKTSSQLVIGRLDRIDGVRRFQRRDMASVYANTRERITVADEPRMLGDANISAKLFNFEFWRETNLRFPEGVVFEDMPVTVGAYLAAKSIDIVSQPVNIWRVRPEGASITQRRTQLKSLEDRLTAIERNLAMIQAAAPSNVLHAYLQRVISLDLQLFVVNLADCDADYFKSFQSRASKILKPATDEDWANAGGAHKNLVRQALAESQQEVAQALKAKGF